MKEGNLRLSLSKVEPNPWNPNEMSRERYGKLKVNIQKTLEHAGKVPPIIVRPLDETQCYQIIDGEHRWKAFNDLNEEKIPVFSMRVDEETARIMTNNLNYLRGTANRDKYARGIMRLVEMGQSVQALGELLPENTEGIEQLLGEVDISVKAYERLTDDEGLEDEVDGVYDTLGDVWATVSFRVTVEQANVIEREIQRIMGQLKGKNKRGRAIEYMAVMSSQGELPGDLV